MNQKFIGKWNYVLILTIVISTLLIQCCKKSSPTGPSDNQWLPATEEVNGSITENEGISILRIWGSAYEKGYAHGYLLAEDIVTMLDNFIGNGTMGMNATTWENQVIPSINAFTIEQGFVEELQGMLAGVRARAEEEVRLSSLSRPLQIEDLTAINVGPDFFSIGCSSFSGWESMTLDGYTITGRNFDWQEIPGVFEKQIVIVYVSESGSNKLGFVSVIWPGSIGCFTAMNEEGVTLNINDTNGYEATQTNGFHPRILIYREAIEAAHAETAAIDVENVLHSRTTSTPQNLMITIPHQNSNAGSVVFEYDGNLSIESGVTVREPEAGKSYQICTNHCRERKSPIECERYALLSNQLEDIATSGGFVYLTREKAWELLDAVFVNNPTHHRIIFEPNQKLMHVALSVVEPAPQYDAVTLNVSELLDGIINTYY